MRLSFTLKLFIVLFSASFHQIQAQVVAPSQGGNVSVIQVSDTSMVLKMGTFGNGQGRIVAIAPTKANTPIPLKPVDNQFYQGSSVYGRGSRLGQGFVVYSGSNHQITVTGLQPNTYYYISTAEYNADSISIAYNTRGTSTISPTRSASTVTTTAIPTPLPVQLVTFTGTVDATSLATLFWTTASEYNSAYFAIEHSDDGITFAETGRIAAAGASSQAMTYKWLDPRPLSAVAYYRLRQVDHNGTSNYSSTITLAPAPPVAQLVEVYPNPGTAQALQVSIQGYEGNGFALHLTDALGRHVFSSSIQPVSTFYRASLGLPATLEAGTYLVTLQTGTTVLHRRVEIHN